MLSRIGLLCSRVVRKTMAISIGSAAFLTLVCSAKAALESGIYQTVTGAAVFEAGDNVTNGSRMVPISATLTFDLTGAQPSLTAVIHNAVLEGGSAYADLWLGGRQQPFELTVHSSSGSQLADGSYKFSGDYLKDIYPAGTQYIFDWQFSTVGAGDPVWSGQTYWAGGHIWRLAISNITVVPVALLNISRAGATTVQISWATNFSNHILEYATSLPPSGWSPVTNAAITNNGLRSVTVDIDALQQRYYRLRKP